MRFFFLLLALWLTSSVAQAETPLIAQETEETLQEPVAQTHYGSIRFRGLNKITTRVQEMEATMGAVTRFGNLEVIPRGCWVAPANKRPEQAGLFEIWYWKQGEKPSLVFYGWMFQSSPALSSLEHPIYDITMLDCVKKPVEETKAEAVKEETAETPENPTAPAQ